MYRTVAQLDEAIVSLANTKPDLCTYVNLSNSVEGQPIRALRLRAGGGADRRGILIVGGMHARELMNPDAIIELAFDLAQAYTDETGLTYGGAEWSALDIRIMMETLDIWMLPCANPDGRNFAMTTDWSWRKNRRENPGTPCKGVDPNRNCDFLWRVIGPTTVCDPCSTTQAFVGSLPFSEPESQNIHTFCDQRRVDVFVDVHSFSEFVLFPWGHAPTQTTQPLPNFTSLLAGFCRALEPPGHQEFMSPSDQVKYQTVATRIADAIKAVRGRNYVLKTIFQVYNGTTSGTSSDYVYSRHISNPTLRKAFAFSFETGPNTGNDRLSFQPADPEPVKRDTKAGLVALIQQSVCAIEFIGETLQAGTVESIRAARDEVLEPSKKGRGWIDFVSSVQHELLGIVLTDKALTKRAMSLLGRVQKLSAARRKAVVSATDVEDGIDFLESLKSRATRPEVREAISVVSRQLKKSSGQTVETILKKLAKSGPPRFPLFYRFRGKADVKRRDPRRSN
jgi:murein tripeptide amidase MpaA